MVCVCLSLQRIYSKEPTEKNQIFPIFILKH